MRFRILIYEGIGFQRKKVLRRMEPKIWPRPAEVLWLVLLFDIDSSFTYPMSHKDPAPSAPDWEH